MPKNLKAVADLDVLDDGTFNVNLTFADPAGVPEAAGFAPAGFSATAVASDAAPGPSSLVLPASINGASFPGSVNLAAVQALVAAGQPLPTGLTVTITATWTGIPNGAPQTVTAAPPIDIVADPNNAGSFMASDASA